MNEIFECKTFYIPRKINYELSTKLLEDIDASLIEWVKKAQANGWTYYVVNTKGRARCCYGSKTITVSATAFVRRTSKQWMIAHETAHAFAGFAADHGPIFMEWLKTICPADSIHLELNYKPGNATRAGILASVDF